MFSKDEHAQNFFFEISKLYFKRKLSFFKEYYKLSFRLVVHVSLTQPLVIYLYYIRPGKFDNKKKRPYRTQVSFNYLHKDVFDFVISVILTYTNNKNIFLQVYVL